MMVVLPVTVTNTSPTSAALAIGITWKPSMTASSARRGSTSVTITWAPIPLARDRKSTRLNSSHVAISYAVFCLKKKKKNKKEIILYNVNYFVVDVVGSTSYNRHV